MANARKARPHPPRLAPILLLAILTGGTGALAAGESRIELRDGSIIGGEVIGVTNGAYRVRSPTLGEVQVRESDVVAIRPMTAGTLATAPADSSAAPATSGADLAAMQQQLLGNPQIMESITRLQGDPAIQAALADPEFMRLVMSGDVATLRGDPRFQRLLENPAIRALVGQVLGR